MVGASAREPTGQARPSQVARREARGAVARRVDVSAPPTAGSRCSTSSRRRCAPRLIACSQARATRGAGTTRGAALIAPAAPRSLARWRSGASRGEDAMQRREFVQDLAVARRRGGGQRLPALLAAEDDVTARSASRAGAASTCRAASAGPATRTKGPRTRSPTSRPWRSGASTSRGCRSRTGSGAARDDWSLIREEPLRHIDNAVELGKQYGIHVNINFHRIPGYCINGREQEPHDLFSGKKAERDRARSTRPSSTGRPSPAATRGSRTGGSAST